ncbi:MAG: hypothetical protein ACYDDU_08180 [Dermatophilaceae bacterium]
MYDECVRHYSELALGNPLNTGTLVIRSTSSKRVVVDGVLIRHR